MKIRRVPSVYSEEQVERYLKRIGWTDPFPEATLSSLETLMQKHIASIPFANTFLVYEEDPPSLDAEELFERIVVQRGGFFCFGMNLIFREVLRAIGYRCYSGIGRVNPNHASNDVYELGGINHMTIFVSFNEDPQASDEKHLYLVDVGFGALGLVAPIPLHPDATQPASLNTVHRIGLRPHPRTSLASQPSVEPSDPRNAPNPLGLDFTLEHQTRNAKDEAEHNWRVLYAFTSAESFAEDYAACHYSTCRTSPLFAKNLLVSVHILPDSPEKRLGRATMWNEGMKRKIAGKEEEVTTFKTETERIEALRTVFGLGNIPRDGLEIVKTKGMSLDN